MPKVCFAFQAMHTKRSSKAVKDFTGGNVEVTLRRTVEHKSSASWFPGPVRKAVYGWCHLKQLACFMVTSTNKYSSRFGNNVIPTIGIA